MMARPLEPLQTPVGLPTSQHSLRRLVRLQNQLQPGGAAPFTAHPAAGGPSSSAHNAAVVIRRISTRDVRFELPAGDGTDSVHSLGGRIYYGYGVTVLGTDREGLAGHGLGFTLGAGTDLVCAAVEHLSGALMGRDIEELMSGFGTVFQRLADHPSLRWLGPHSGVVHLALASISNACFDLWARARGLPLWELLLSLPDEQLVDLLDLSYVDDVLSREGALALLAAERPHRDARRALALEAGIPGYDTSAGWMDCTDDEITARSRGEEQPSHPAVAPAAAAAACAACRAGRAGRHSEAIVLCGGVCWCVRAAASSRRNIHRVPGAVAAGFKAVKLKVGGLGDDGSEARDLRRLSLVRGAVGERIRVAFDANQQWSVAQAARVVGKLRGVVDQPLFVEEPTHPHDVAAHATIARAIAPIPVAVGESIPNRVVFKNFMAAGAVQVCQVDPTRLGGVGEALTCAMMARKLSLRVIPHVGDMGQISQHLCLFYHIALGLPTEFLECQLRKRFFYVFENLRICCKTSWRLVSSGVMTPGRYIPHLRDYFVQPALVRGGRYIVPHEAGASTAIVDAEEAQRIYAERTQQLATRGSSAVDADSGARDITRMYEGATNLGDS